MREKIIFVTNDRFIKEGRLDPIDEAVLKEAAAGGELVIMNTREAFEAMKAEKPIEFDKFHKIMEESSGIPLTFPQLIEFARKAGETFSSFSEWIECMTELQARFVRKLRVEEHCTWRTVARACYIIGFGDWSPAYNQLAGMALCKHAAAMLKEDYMTAPWN
jgi:hypothetical protein